MREVYKTGKAYFYKKFSVGLFLDTSVEGFEHFLDLYEDYIRNIYFSLPMGDRFHSRRRVVEQFHDQREIDKFWILLDIIQRHNIDLELLFNTGSITEADIYRARDILEEHKIHPTLVGLQDQYYNLVKEVFPECKYVYSFNNAPHSWEDYRAQGHQYQEYVIGRGFIRDTGLYDYIHYQLKGETILLVNNGCSFICGGCQDTQHCRNAYLKAQQTESNAMLYAKQSIMPFELHEGWLDLDMIDLIKINTRNSNLEYVKNCIRSYIFGHEEEWISLSKEYFSLWAHLTWHFPYFGTFSYQEIRKLKLRLYQGHRAKPKEKLLFYDEENLEKLYLTPYTRYQHKEESIAFFNVLYEREVVLSLDKGAQQMLLQTLKRGCTAERLMQILVENGLEQSVFEELLLGCIIE